MSGTDALTIFMPVSHYHEAYLRQAVACVFAQTSPDWRLLLVVDHGRQDHFRALLPEASRDPRVRIIGNSGRLLGGSYNTAMRAAETEFIAVLLGDDLWTLDAVAVLRETVKGCPEADFVHAGRYFINGKGARISSDYLPSVPVTRDAFIAGSPVKHLLCWRVRLGLACGGVDETLNNHASDDYDFPWTMLEHGARFHAVPQALYVMRDHRDGVRLTTHVPRNVQREELRRILTKHGVPPAVIARRVRDAGRTYMRQALFRNGLQRWLLEHLGFNAERGWRERYR